MARAAILTELNSPLVVEDISPQDLNYGQVLVKVIVSGLCGAQLQEIKGLKNNKKFLPHLLGHEGCGQVVAIGSGVTKVKPGDKVIMHWRKGTGIESDFPKYHFGSKTIGGGKVTTLCEMSIASENRLTVVPQDTPETLCALLGCGLSTALGVVNIEARVRFGESVLVLGCGGIGLNIILASRMVNAGNIYGIDITEEKRSMVEQFGASYINIKDQNLDIKEAIDCIIDTTGDLGLVSKYLPLLSSQGRCILVSLPKTDTCLHVTNPMNLFNESGQCIKTTQGGGVQPEYDFVRYIKVFKDKKDLLDRIITHTFSLADINTAVQLLQAGHAGRIMINIG